MISVLQTNRTGFFLTRFPKWNTKFSDVTAGDGSVGQVLSAQHEDLSMISRTHVKTRHVHR